MSTFQDDQQGSNPSILLSSLQNRANTLLSDLKAYQTLLQSQNCHQHVELRNFKRGVESEAKVLNAVLTSEYCVQKDSETEHFEPGRLHALRSSNLPFYEAVWSVARRCKAVVALGKKVSCEHPNRERTVNGVSSRSVNRSESRRSAVVDIMAEDGLEWIKVSTITEKRLLFEMAKEGWEGYGDASDSDEHEYTSEGDVHASGKGDGSQLEIVKLAKTLTLAASQTRVRYTHPRVEFVLPKVHEGLYQDVDAVIADIRSMGVEVVCADKVNTDDTINIEALTLESQTSPYDSMLPKSAFFFPGPTSNLNIDCTILLSLISDISHVPSPSIPPHPSNPSGTYHNAITRQIDNESVTPLLPSELYPLLTDRNLVCTSHAAQRMREIVRTMGTEGERARANVLLGEEECTGLEETVLSEKMGRLSCHSVPQGLKLPIKIVDFDVETHGDKFSGELAVVRRVVERMNLSMINKSVFVFGWVEGMVTVTSNRATANGLVKCINEVLDEGERETQPQRRGGDVAGSTGKEMSSFIGPHLYVCETARSLIGKEKQGGRDGRLVIKEQSANHGYTQ